MKSGVTLVLELVTKKLALFEVDFRKQEVNYYGNYERRWVCARQTQKTRQGSSQNTLYAATSRNKAKKAYRGQGK